MCDFLNQVFISPFKIWLIITLYPVLFRSRLSDACQPGDTGVGRKACFHSYSSARENVLNRDRSVPVRSVFISPPRHCLFEWKQVQLPFCPLCEESHVNPWVKWLHISPVFHWWFSPPLWVVTLDHCQAGLLNPALGKSQSHSANAFRS